MDESEDNMSAEELKYLDSPFSVISKSKKRSLVERELETNLTARVTSPITNGENHTTSRYGRTRRLKTDVDSSDSEKSIPKTLKSPKFEKSPVRIQSPVYKMHASNSPLRMDTPKRSLNTENKLETQIEHIYNENISLSRFGSEEKKKVSPAKKFPKVYIRKDIIQSKEKEKVETITLIKNMFSPIKGNKQSSTHLNNIFERSSEKYSITTEQNNGYLDTSSVVKTLDFDGNKKKKRENKDCKITHPKSNIFEIEAKCEYQVGDLVWARMGTYPFWPCIVTRDPLCGTFVKKKLFCRIERDVLHVTFFGDNGRRGWIVDNMLRKFLGQIEFETTRERFTSEAKKRDPRLYAAFFISEKKQSQWIVSVQEAEALLREPKRLRIDILRDMLEKSRTFKTTPRIERSGKITRTNSDVSLSESLYDTLFSEDDTKNNDNERAKSKTRNKSLDVSEVVTACLDNMAAKTGITKIQRQSHMDRWLQKAKSKTPEKSFFKTQNFPKTDKELKSNNVKRKRSTSKDIRPKKSLSLRKSKNESQDEIESKLLSHQNEHDYSKLDYRQYDNIPVITDEVNHVRVDDCNKTLSIDKMCSNIGPKSKADNCLNKTDEQNKTEEIQDVFFTVVNEELVTKVESNKEHNLVQNQTCETVSESLSSLDVEPMQIDLNDIEVQKTNLAKVTLISLPDNLENNDTYSVGVYGIHQSKVVLDNSNLEDVVKIGKEAHPNDMIIDAMLNVEKCDGASDLNILPVDKANNVDMLAFQNPLNNIDNIEYNESADNNIKLGNDKIEVSNHNRDRVLKINNTENILESEDESTYNDETSSRTLYNVMNSKRSQDSEHTVSDNNDTFKESLMFQYDDVINNLLESNDIPSKLKKRLSTRNVLQDDTDESCSISSTVESIDQDAENATDNDTNYRVAEIEHNFKSNTIVEINNCRSERNNSSVCNLQNHDTFVNVQDIIKINPVPIENSLSNCEMVCLPNHITENILDSKMYSDVENVIQLQSVESDNVYEEISCKKTKLDDTLTNDNIQDYIVEENGQRTKDLLQSECAGEISKNNDIDQNQLCEEIRIKEDNSRQASENGSNEKTGDNEVHSNRNSDIEEMESMDSDYTEELVSSNDPNSELDPINDERRNDNTDQKLSDNFTDSFSMSSEISEISENKQTHRGNYNKRTENKSTVSLKKDLKNPEFLKYFELRQDTLIDENPHLSQEEITSYLYNTWLYEESFKSERKKIDDIDQSNLVKGLTHAPVQPKRIRKKAKVKTEMYENEEVTLKSKSKRKIVRPYYNEDYSDLEHDLEMFELFESRVNSVVASDIRHDYGDNVNTGIYNEADLESNGEYDQVEEYFDQLTRAKPHLFKGLMKEKVCEICEKVGNLVKCKSCHYMFHIECTKKETGVTEPQTPTKGRKKKKRNRGRRQKNSEDPNSVDLGSQSDEKSQDLNASEENVSIEDVESESHLVVDAEGLEAQLCAKMKEMFHVLENEYYSDSSENELDWSDTEAGKCKIIDIKLPQKNRNKDGSEYSDFKCNKCTENGTPVCFVCKSPTSPRDGAQYRQKCQVAHCHRFYHLECLDHWPQTQFSSGEASRNNKKIKGFFEPMTCPRHMCHTCVSDDPRGCKTRFSGDKLARCVRCPATYHSFTKCIPAGTQILTGTHIICPRHYEHRPGKVPCHVNTGWCFICALGGSLICCEYCPTSFHAECLNIKPPEGGYMCEDCETGRLPLYGEMVWVKLGHYRWWPGIILHPSEIPANILAVKHSPGEFVVRFFGQYDHYWVNRGRVFPFQEGDTGKVSSQKSKIDAAFSMAMEHAKRACEILKNVTPNEEESLDIASSLLPPHYVKLKVNKPCGSLCGRRVDIEENSLTQCECNPDEEDPCGPYSQCLNRMLLTECGPSCRAGDRCNNRAFEKRLYPKLVPYRTPHRGWGLKTLENIKAGQFVIEYVGELIDEDEFKRRMERKYEIRDENYYFLTLDKERMIDAGPKGNLARFMNHCCEPNCETQKWTVLGDVRVGLFAKRDIPANSEVTFNYNLQCAGIEKKRCLCGAKGCSGYIGAKPKQNGSQPKKIKKEMQTKRTYKKRKNVEISPPVRAKAVKRASRSKPRELTEIEKDLLIIKNATNGMSSDSDCSGRLSVDSKEARALKRRRVDFFTEEILYNGNDSPNSKRLKTEDGD